MADNPVIYGFSTNALDREINNALTLARRVQGALDASAPTHERENIKKIIGALEKVAEAATDVECPNPFFSFFTVDKDKLMGRP
jgi:hypothetical protein